MEALLIVDIDSTDDWDIVVPGGNNDEGRVARAIVKELKFWRRSGKLIVFVTLSKYKPESLFQLLAEDEKNPETCLGCSEGYPGLADFLKHRHGADYEPVFMKVHSNAFKSSSLADFLREKGVKKIWLAGCNTFACILDTAIGAVENGFEVALLEKCAYPPFGGKTSVKTCWLNLVKSRSNKKAKVAIYEKYPYP